MTEVAPDYSDLPAGTRAVNVGGGKIVVFTKAESDAVRGKLDRYVVGMYVQAVNLGTPRRRADLSVCACVTLWPSSIGATSVT